MINKINVISKVVILQSKVVILQNTYDNEKMLLKDFTIEEHNLLTRSTSVISSIASPSYQ